ncbi:MAG: prephenate dehydrogenase/arogenate dehydrogenase family protein [Actinomycetota bacterium]
MRRLAVLGTGLIGGSIALRVRRDDETVEVAGYDADPAALAGAVRRGAVTHAARSVADAVTGADLVVLALPVDRIPAAVEDVARLVGAETVVTDVGSSKGEVVRSAGAVPELSFVGGHPMAGSERHGIEAADPDLFEDAWWVLTPTAGTSSADYSRVTDLVSRLGAKPIALDPAVHDALVARLSHLPQLAASALVEVAAGAGDKDALLGLAAGGFRDVTRIAASESGMWLAILRTNRIAILDALDGLEQRLRGLRRMLIEHRWDELRTFLEGARTARLELFAKPAYAGTPVTLTMLVPDRPGVLAEVTTAAGELGANIEDLNLFHSTEGGRGRLEVIIAGEGSAEALRTRLEDLGYHVDRGLPE